jgi:hypothetical protein
MKKLKGVMVAASTPGSSMAERKLYSVIFTTLIVGLMVMAPATPTLAGQANSQNAANGRFFIGFWEGIDPLDGSTVQLSISDNDRDGVFDYIFREGFFTSCFTAQNTKGRGVVIGTGTLVEPGVIEVVADQTCFDDENQIEAVFEIFPVIRAAPKGANLILGSGGFPSILMHRTGN